MAITAFDTRRSSSVDEVGAPDPAEREEEVPATELSIPTSREVVVVVEVVEVFLADVELREEWPAVEDFRGFPSGTFFFEHLFFTLKVGDTDSLSELDEAVFC